MKSKRLQKILALLMSFLLTAESVGFMAHGNSEPADGAENIPSDDIYDNGAMGTEDTSSDERYEEENTENSVKAGPCSDKRRQDGQCKVGIHDVESGSES